MRFANSVGWAVCVAALCHASPVAPAALVAVPGSDVAIRAPGLLKRTSSSCDLSKSWKNERLFDGSHKNDKGKTSALTVTCADCYTKGSVTASLTGDDMTKPKMRLDLSSVEAYVDLALAFSDSSVYTINLFKSSSLSVGVEGLFDIGIVVYLDLVFSLSAEIEISHGGFYLQVAEGAFLEASLLDGIITSSNFKGLGAKSLPVTLVSGEATFQADLRLRAECGAEGSLAGIGAGVELGIYANLIEFVSTLETSSAAECGVRATESWGMNAGCYAHADVHVDYDHYSAVPTVSTTLLSMPKSTQCWGSSGHGGHGSGSHTTATHTYGGHGGHGSKSSSTEASTTFSTTTSTSAEATTSSLTTSLLTTSSLTSVVSTTAFYGTNQSIPVNTNTVTSTDTTTGTSTDITTATSTDITTATSSVLVTSTAVVSSVGGETSTSTVFTTTVYTITSCAASVVNCPATYASAITVTQTVAMTQTETQTETQTATQTDTATAAITAAVSASAVPTAVTITDVIVMVPCPTPVVSTFTPPAVTSTADTTAVAGATDTAATAAASASAATAATAAITAAGSATLAATFTTQWSNGTAGGATLVTPSLGAGTASATAPGSAVVTAGVAPVVAGGRVALLAGALAGMLLL